MTKRNSIENCTVELIASEQIVAEVKVQRNIFLRDLLSSLLLIRAMIPPTCVLKNTLGSYKFTKSQEKISHFMDMDCIKVFVENEKEVEAFEFGKEKSATLLRKSEKRIVDGIVLPIRKEVKRKIIRSGWKKWNQTPSNKQRWMNN